MSRSLEVGFVDHYTGRTVSKAHGILQYWPFPSDHVSIGVYVKDTHNGFAEFILLNFHYCFRIGTVTESIGFYLPRNYEPCGPTVTVEDDGFEAHLYFSEDGRVISSDGIPVCNRTEPHLR